MSPGLERPSGKPPEARRTQRVLLRVPIQVFASFGEHDRIMEDTATVEVNAHGARIALAMRVRPGQRIVMRNWGTGKEQEGRVVHIMQKPSGKNEVGVAFPFAAPKFWNIQFPPEDWTPYIEIR